MYKKEDKNESKKNISYVSSSFDTTQVQGVTFADTKNGNQENNKVNEVVVGNSNESNSDSATEKSEDNQEGNLEKDNKSEESNGAATEDKEQTEKENN